MHPRRCFGSNPVVSAPPFDLREFFRQLDLSARQAGFAAERWGEVDGHPLLAYTKAAARPEAPGFYLSAGMHGDEPAPPLAMLNLVENGAFADGASWTICPVLNPTGLVRGTRENAAGVDLNRDYKSPVTTEVRAHVAWLRRQPRYAATFCLHEDYEATGFYLYELSSRTDHSAAAAVLNAVEPIGAIERSTIIDGREASAPGIIRPVNDPLLRDQWPEAIYLREKHTELSYTFETASLLPLAQRIAMHVAAVRAAVRALYPPGKVRCP